MTKVLLDENVPTAVGFFLRRMDFDVVHANEVGMRGASDVQTMDLAQREERVPVTFDKHFSDLLLYSPATHFGVIRIRIHPPLLADIEQAFESFLKKYDMSTIRGALIVLERNGFRVRRASLT